MLKPLEQFYCDTCGNIIENPEDGYIEWVSEIDEKTGIHLNSKYKIVHHLSSSSRKNNNMNGCYIHNCKSLSLKEFLANKDVELLSFIDLDPYLVGKKNGNKPCDMIEYVDFAKRITLPYYEEARKYWEAAQSDGYFVSVNEVAIYSPEFLSALIEKYN